MSTEYLSHTEDKNGITAKVRDRVSGDEFEIRAKYLIGADGGNSLVAENIKLPVKGKMGVGGSINIIIEADLSKYVAHRPSVLYWVLQPGSNVGGIGMGVVRMVRPWNEWLIIWGYDINEPAPKVTEAFAKNVVYSLIGEKTVDVKVKSVSTWTVNHMHAEKYSKGRVFCMGDAVHRHPPSNGLGSNTSIQDAYNLAWKMAHVLRGKATPKLLDSYNTERAPIGKQIVDRANKSIGEFGPIFDALGLLSTQDPKLMKANMESRKEATVLGATRREKLREAIAFKKYEFDCHGVEMNHRYKSKAVVSDGTPMPKFKKDAELYHQATSWPGAHVPHVWLEKNNTQLATVDLCGKGKFTLLTSIGGEAWLKAAKEFSKKTGVEINALTIGPGCDIEDPFGDWARMREIDDNGCLLIRPDMVVGFRAKAMPKNPSTALNDALNQILGH